MARGGGAAPVVPLIVASVPDSNTITFQSAYPGTPGTKSMTWHDYTLPYTLPRSYSTKTDIYGKESTISGSTINVGYTPVLLSNSPGRGRSQ